DVAELRPVAADFARPLADVACCMIRQQSYVLSPEPTPYDLMQQTTVVLSRVLEYLDRHQDVAQQVMFDNQMAPMLEWMLDKDVPVGVTHVAVQLIQDMVSVNAEYSNDIVHVLRL